MPLSVKVSQEYFTKYAKYIADTNAVQASVTACRVKPVLDTDQKYQLAAETGE